MSAEVLKFPADVMAQARAILASSTAAHWGYNLDRNSKNEIRSHLDNALVALRDAPELRGMFRYDAMDRVVMLSRPLDEIGGPVEIPFVSRPVRDTDVSAVQAHLIRVGMKSMLAATMHQAVEAHAVTQ